MNDTKMTQQRRDLLKLHLVDGVGPVLLRRLLDAFGSASAALTASVGQLQRVRGVGDAVARAIRQVTDDRLDDELALAEARGARAVLVGDEEYPPCLAELPNRPPVLYVRGHLGIDETHVGIGVVGSRRCTQYGLEQAERFGQLLGRAGFTVVSGGARGIDTACHRGAILADGRTVAVMGCGLCTSYPRENEALFERIVGDARGALVSELPMRTAVLRGNFPTRNRIIAGLSAGVLVVEAARRSGTMHTLRQALENNRETFAVPGRVDSPTSQGTNALISRGEAKLVQDLEDILDGLGDYNRSLLPPEPENLPLPAGLSETERRLVEALGDEAMTVDAACLASGVPAHEAVAAMTMLALKGVIEQRPGNYFARKTRRGVAD